MTSFPLKLRVEPRLGGFLREGCVHSRTCGVFPFRLLFSLPGKVPPWLSDKKKLCITGLVRNVFLPNVLFLKNGQCQMRLLANEAQAHVPAGFGQEKEAAARI